MNQKINMKEIERKAYTLYQEDGILEITAALVGLTFAIALVIDMPKQWVITEKAKTRPSRRKNHLSFLSKAGVIMPCLYLKITRGIKKIDTMG